MADHGPSHGRRDVTAYLVFLIAVVTLASLQFGIHLAELNAPQHVIMCPPPEPPVAPPSAMARLSKWVGAASRSSSSSSSKAADAPPPDCIPMDEAGFATVSSVFLLGGLAGALCAGPYSSRRGRLPAMRATALLYVAGALVETLAPSAWVMALGRFTSGLGAGASTVIVPLYISEVSPPPQRGLFGAMTQVSINLGIVLTQTLGFLFSTRHQWRWILGAGVCAAAIQIIGLLVVPESPAWLAAHGDAAKATRTLQRIRAKGADSQSEVAAWSPDGAAGRRAEEEGLLAPSDAASPSAAGKQPLHLGFVDVVRDPRHRPAIVAVVGVMFAQQLCGINSVIMYSVSLFANLFPVSSALLTVLVSVVNLAMTIACAPLPDRLGRKTCLLMSIVGQGTSSLVLALSIMLGAKNLSALAVLSFVAFFAVGLGPVPFILASELVSHEAVGATQSWSLAANYLATFVVAQFFPIINTALNSALGGQGWAYFVFAALAAMSAVFVMSRVPETRGNKDVDEVWGRARRLD